MLLFLLPDEPNFLARSCMLHKAHIPNALNFMGSCSELPLSFLVKQFIVTSLAPNGACGSIMELIHCSGQFAEVPPNNLCMIGERHEKSLG